MTIRLCVRAAVLLKVTLSAARGLQLEAMTSLQTASTHILCLHSFSCSPSSPSSSSSSSRAVFLCAGTNMGTVYVWRLAGSQLASLADRDRSLLLGDRCLHSHLQSSEDPIIHISMAAAAAAGGGLGGPGGEEDLALALLASDNQGGVHLHLASTRPDAPAPGPGPFFLAASQCFPSAVVGCGFRGTPSPTPSPLPPRGTQRRTAAGLEETLTQAQTTTTTTTMTAAICLLQGQLVLRCNRPPLLLGRCEWLDWLRCPDLPVTSPLFLRASLSPGAGIGVGPGGAAAVRVPVSEPVLPQELLSMQSLGRDILSQLAADAACHTRTDSQSQSQRETGRAFKGQLQLGGVAGEEEEEEEEDVLPRAALSAPSPARHWLGSGSPPPPPPPLPAADRPLAAPVPRPVPATDSEVRVAEHREEISRHQRQMGALTSRSPVAYHDTFCQSHNSYARPALHSSQVRSILG